MAELPQVNAKEAIRAFEKAGFAFARKKGSHVVLKKPEHRYVLTVPDHGSKSVATGTLRSLIADAGLTVEQFVELLN